MKRLFKKDAALITPLPPDASPQYTASPSPSPSPYPIRHHFQPGRGAQPSLPPTAPAASVQHPIRSQHQAPTAPDGARYRDRPRSHQLLDGGPQPLLRDPYASAMPPPPPSHPQHRHSPSMPSPSKRPQHPLYPPPLAGSQSSDPPGLQGPGGGPRSQPDYPTYALQQPPPEAAVPQSGRSRDTDSDDDTAYLQSRTLNELVPRSHRAAQPSDPSFALGSSGSDADNNTRAAFRHHARQGSSPQPSAAAPTGMRPQHSNQSSAASQGRPDRAPSRASPPPDDGQWPKYGSTVQDRPHQDASESSKRGSLGLRRWRSNVRKDRDQGGEAAADRGAGPRPAHAEPPSAGTGAQSIGWRSGRSGAPFAGAVAATGAPAAYPVYPSSGEVDSETLISAGSTGGHQRRADGERNKDRDKGKKKRFGFGSKEPKGSNAAAAATASAGGEALMDASDLGGSRPSHTIRRDDEPQRNLASSQPQKEHHWYDPRSKKKGGKAAKEAGDREVEGIVTAKIGWLCAQQAATDDWEVVLSLAESVSQSDAASKEAARALRKEFKYGSMVAQKRAARIWAVLTVNSSERFKQQIASKRFLEVVEETISSSKTPLSVKETMLRVLGVLAFEFRGDAQLSSVTKCWNKVKPRDRPVGGEPMDPTMEFALPLGDPVGPATQPSIRAAPPVAQPYERGDQPASEPSQHAEHDMERRSSAPIGAIGAIGPTRPHLHSFLSHDGLAAAQPRRLALPELPPSSAATKVTTVVPPTPTPTPTQPPPPVSPPSLPASLYAMATLDTDIRKLHEECQIARSNANVLVETMLTEGLQSETRDLVDEFYQKALVSQEFLMSQVPWASAQADRARDAAANDGSALALTKQELLLSDLLESHEKCVEAARMVDEARRQAEEDEEERRVTELSKLEVRLDRSALLQDAETGELYDNGYRGQQQLAASGASAHHLGASAHASGSRSPSPNPAACTHAGGSGSGSASHVGSSGGSTAYQPAPSRPSAAGSGAAQSQTPMRASRPLPIPGSDRSSADSHGSAAKRPSQPESASHNPGPGSIDAASAHSREPSHASSTLASHNPYAGILAAAAPNNSGASGASTTPFHRSSLGSLRACDPTVAPTATATATASPPLHTRPLAMHAAPAPRLPPHPDRSTHPDPPLVPSEKALGKRRAMSRHEDNVLPSLLAAAEGAQLHHPPPS
ncbi:hypothetical protein ACQY0O_001438 [Thecaphora frezii]